jgi:hypothetical protein
MAKYACSTQLVIKTRSMFKNWVKHLAITILVFGCSEPEIEIDNIIKIDLDNKSVYSEDLGSVFLSIKLIPLQLSDESLISKVSKIIPYRKQYIIFDEDQKAVFFFKDNGNYIRKIDRVGKGPGEYQVLYDVVINEYTNNIELLSPDGNIFIYEMNGEWIKSISIPEVMSVHKFEILNEDIIVLYTGSSHEREKLFYYSRNQNKIIKRFYSYPLEYHNSPFVGGQSPFFKTDEALYFFEKFSNNGYELKSSTMHLRYSWDFGKHNFQIENIPLDEPIEVQVKYVRDKDLAYSFKNTIENSDLLVTQFSFRKELINLFYNKTSKSYKLFKGFIPLDIEFTNDRIIGSCPSEYIEAILSPDHLDNRNLKIFNTAKDHVNPVLIMYEF